MKDKTEIILPPVASSDRELDLVNLTEYLTKTIFKGKWQGGGLLGGEFGYGVDFKNDTFVMFPYYWGDCTCGWSDMEFDEPHEDTCYQNLVDKDLLENGFIKDKDGWVHAPAKWSYDKGEAIQDKIREKYCKKFGLSFPGGCAVHCTCKHDKDFKKWLKENQKGKNGHADDCLVEVPNFKHYKSGLEIRWYKWIGRDTEFNKKITDSEWRELLADCIKSIPKPRSTKSKVKKANKNDTSGVKVKRKVVK